MQGKTYASLLIFMQHAILEIPIWPLQVAEETIANDEVVVIKGGQSGRAVSVLLRGANDYMLDEMDRSLHDSFCVVKRVLESGAVVPGAATYASVLSCLLYVAQTTCTCKAHRALEKKAFQAD